jgi:hypothetical protein
MLVEGANIAVRMQKATVPWDAIALSLGQPGLRRLAGSKKSQADVC